MLKVLAISALVLAVVLGLFAYRMSSSLIHQNTQAQPQANASEQAQTMAVVAVRPLQANQPIAADAVKRVPVAVPPLEYYQQTQAVIGKRPLVNVPVGTTLVPSDFQSANNLSHNIPAGYVGMSLKIDDVIAVGGLVAPGDHVNVLVYVRNNGQQVEDAQARILLKDAVVIALNGKQPSTVEVPKDNNDRSDDRRERRQVQRRQTPNVVLAVPKDDATRVMLGASVGELRLALLPKPEPVPVAEPTMLADSATAQPGPAAIAPQATLAADAADKSSDDSQKIDPIKAQRPITLSELTRLKKEQKKKHHASQPKRHYQPSVIVYRGNEVSRER